MVSMALWVLEMGLGLRRRVESWNAMVDDEVKMQVKCLLKDEMQSTIRQSGVTWAEENGNTRRIDDSPGEKSAV